MPLSETARAQPEARRPTTRKDHDARRCARADRVPREFRHACPLGDSSHRPAVQRHRPRLPDALLALVRCLPLLRTLLLAAASVAGAAEFGLQLRDAGDASGAEVSVVAAGSSAATAGVRPGDIVRRLEQTPVTGADQFSSLARSLPAGKPVTLRISRQGWERDILLPAEATTPDRRRPRGSGSAWPRWLRESSPPAAWPSPTSSPTHRRLAPACSRAIS